MPKCVFENCDSGSRKKGKNQMNLAVHLHRFPKDINLCLKWLQQIEYGQSINAKSVNLKTGNIIYSYEIDINIIHVYMYCYFHLHLLIKIHLAVVCSLHFAPYHIADKPMIQKLLKYSP